MNNVSIFSTSTELLEQVADELCSMIFKRDKGKKFRIVLTGGSLGIGLLQELSSRVIDLTGVEFLMGDERWVGFQDADRNEAQAQAAWPQLNSAEFMRFGSPAEMNLAEGAREANSRLANLIELELDFSFDLVLLGVGPDGHVASLFPQRHSNQNRWIVYETASPKPPAERLSLSFEALNRAKHVWFLAAGSSKSGVVSQALSAAGATDLPCARVRGLVQTRWFVDEELAQGL